MTIGEVARRARVTASRIRFYEAEGILPAVQRGANGYRIYSESTVDLLMFIEGAQKLGFTLKEIKRGAPSPVPPHLSPRAMLGPLRRKLRDVEAHLAATTEQRDTLLDLVRTFEACVSSSVKKKGRPSRKRK